MTFLRRGSERPPDDESLELIARRLRNDDPADPPYEPGRFAQLASGGRLYEAGPAERRLVGRRVRSPLLGGLGVGSLGLALILVVGVVAIRLNVGSQTGSTPSPGSSDLLSAVRSRGVLRVAIRPDFPQATTDKLAGFDIDVANALASRLGVRLEIVIVEASMMASSAPPVDWDVAMPSSSLVARAAAGSQRATRTTAFPTFLVVSEASGAQVPADLKGSRICVVEGSAGEAWIAGAIADPTVAPPSDGSISRVEANDQACLDALSSGDVDAMVTATLSAADIAVRASIRSLGQPVLLDPRSVVVRKDGPDPSAMLEAIDAAFSDMRIHGTLVDLSRNRFGGQDLSSP